MPTPSWYSDEFYQLMTLSPPKAKCGGGRGHGACWEKPHFITPGPGSQRVCVALTLLHCDGFKFSLLGTAPMTFKLLSSLWPSAQAIL